MLQGLLETYNVSPDISVSHLAQRTAVSIFHNFIWCMIPSHEKWRLKSLENFEFRG